MMLHRHPIKIATVSMSLLLLFLSGGVRHGVGQGRSNGDAGQVRALAAQNKDEINKLKEIGSNANGGSIQTTLMVAAARGQKEVVLALLEAGADVNIKNWYGWTALLERRRTATLRSRQSSSIGAPTRTRDSGTRIRR